MVIASGMEDCVGDVGARDEDGAIDAETNEEAALKDLLRANFSTNSACEGGVCRRLSLRKTKYPLIPAAMPKMMLPTVEPIKAFSKSPLLLKLQRWGIPCDERPGIRELTVTQAQGSCPDPILRPSKVQLPTSIPQSSPMKYRRWIHEADEEWIQGYKWSEDNAQAKPAKR